MSSTKQHTTVNSGSNIRSLCFTGVMAALIFVFTFTFKIPLPNGYAHLGDMFIIVAVWLLGIKRAPLAAGIGAALADLVSGYAMWILPTFIVKFVMALVICLIAEKAFHSKRTGYVIGIIAGALLHIGGYEIAWYILGGKAGAVAAIIPLSLQTICGAVLGIIIILALQSSGAGKRLKKMVD